MQRPSARVTAALLCVGIVVTAVVLLGLSTTAVPVPPRWRGALIGIAAGMYGVFFFEFGYLRGGRRPRLRTVETDREQSGPAPDEAKFWLKKFLEEQQKK